MTRPDDMAFVQSRLVRAAALDRLALALALPPGHPERQAAAAALARAMDLADDALVDRVQAIVSAQAARRPPAPAPAPPDDLDDPTGSDAGRFRP